VNELVFSHTTELSKCFLTNVTCVRFLAGMNAFVCCQSTELSKRLITNVTCVWFDTSVKAFVYSEVEQMLSHKCHMCKVSHHYECICV